MITSLQKCTLVPGGVEVVVYGTIMGGVGVLLPFASREDVDFFQHLEMHMRQSHPPLAGRDHMAYRGSYFPVKDVVDGALAATQPAPGTALGGGQPAEHTVASNGDVEEPPNGSPGTISSSLYRAPPTMSLSFG